MGDDQRNFCRYRYIQIPSLLMTKPGRVVRKRVSNAITFAQKLQDLTIMINSIAPLDDSMIEDHTWIEKLGHVFSFYSHSLKLGTAPDHLLYLHQFWFCGRYFDCSNAACFPKWRPAFQNAWCPLLWELRRKIILWILFTWDFCQ
jgi:hypothetical protein